MRIVALLFAVVSPMSTLGCASTQTSASNTAREPSIQSTASDTARELAIRAPDGRRISLTSNLTKEGVPAEDMGSMVVLPSPVPGMILISVTGRGYYLNTNERWKIGDTLQPEDIAQFFIDNPLLGIQTCSSEASGKQFQYQVDRSNRIFSIQVKYMSDGTRL